MKRFTPIAAALALLAASASAQSPAATVRLAVAPESKVLLEGDSNLHGWHCNTSSFDATIEMDAAAIKAADAPLATALRSASVKIPIAKIDCGNDGLEKNLAKALKADASPTITYTMSSVEAAPADSAGLTTLKATGKVNVAGKDTTVTMLVRATRTPNGGIKAHGETELLMTSFGIKPPTAMLGTMRTKDKVVVKFELLVGPEVVAAALGGTEK